MQHAERVAALTDYVPKKPTQTQRTHHFNLTTKCNTYMAYINAFWLF